MDRFAEFSLVASRPVIADARLDLAPALCQAMGVYIGRVLGGVVYGEERHERSPREGARSASPTLALAVLGCTSSCNIAIALGIHGPAISKSDSCESGAIAIGKAARPVRGSRAPALLAGGVAAHLALLNLGDFSSVETTSTRNDEPALASRPFDRDRDGFVLGARAIVFVPEGWSHDEARGAEILAEVAGYGTTNDAYHMTAPLPSGKQPPARSSPRSSTPRSIRARSTRSTRMVRQCCSNDATELKAIRDVLDQHADRVPVGSRKGADTPGASGAIEAGTCALALCHQWVSPTVNSHEPDAECDLPDVPRRRSPAPAEFRSFELLWRRLHERQPRTVGGVTKKVPSYSAALLTAGASSQVVPLWRIWTRPTPRASSARPIRTRRWHSFGRDSLQRITVRRSAARSTR